MAKTYKLGHDKLPIQKLLDGAFLRIVRLHQDLNDLSEVPHRHDHYEMMLVMEGSGKHSINFKSFEVKPHQLYFLHPRTGPCYSAFP